MSRPAPPHVPAAVLGPGLTVNIRAELGMQASHVVHIPDREVLAAVLVALEWAAALGARAVATVPAAASTIPCDLVPRMTPLIQYGRVIVASDGVRVHPTIGLWPTVLLPRLTSDLARGAHCPEAWSRAVGRIEVLYLDASRGLFGAAVEAAA